MGTSWLKSETTGSIVYVGHMKVNGLMVAMTSCDRMDAPVSISYPPSYDSWMEDTRTRGAWRMEQ